MSKASGFFKPPYTYPFSYPTTTNGDIELSSSSSKRRISNVIQHLSQRDAPADASVKSLSISFPVAAAVHMKKINDVYQNTIKSRKTSKYVLL